MALIEPMHLNNPNVSYLLTYLLTYLLHGQNLDSCASVAIKVAKPNNASHDNRLKYLRCAVPETGIKNSDMLLRPCIWYNTPIFITDYPSFVTGWFSARLQ